MVWGGNHFVQEHFTMPGLSGYLVSVPHANSQAGGDLHFITVCNQGVFSKFLLLDVAGHGELAAPVSARLKEPLTRLMTEPDNRAILTELNESILRNEQAGSFATAVSATYNDSDQFWTYAYAGHPNMLVLERGGWQKLSEEGASSLPVGVLAEVDYFQNTVQLAEDQWVVMFSDVLLEVRNRAGRQLGFPGLIEMLNSIREVEVGTFYEAFAQRLTEYNGGDQFSDDLTVILLKRETLQI